MFDGAKLRELRENKNMNTEDCSYELGISKTMLSFFERNMRNPKSDFVERASKLFKVNINDLFNDD